MKKPKRKPKKRGAPPPEGKPATPGGETYRVMTVALIRDPKEADAVQVAFSESARFYSLLRKNPAFERILRELRVAKEAKQPVHVMVETPQSNVIVDVKR